MTTKSLRQKYKNIIKHIKKRSLKKTQQRKILIWIKRYQTDINTKRIQGTKEPKFLQSLIQSILYVNCHSSFGRLV